MAQPVKPTSGPAPVKRFPFQAWGNLQAWEQQPAEEMAALPETDLLLCSPFGFFKKMLVGFAAGLLFWETDPYEV